MTRSERIHLVLHALDDYTRGATKRDLWYDVRVLTVNQIFNTLVTLRRRGDVRVKRTTNRGELIYVKSKRRMSWWKSLMREMFP